MGLNLHILQSLEPLESSCLRKPIYQTFAVGGWAAIKIEIHFFGSDNILKNKTRSKCHVSAVTR